MYAFAVTRTAPVDAIGRLHPIQARPHAYTTSARRTARTAANAPYVCAGSSRATAATPATPAGSPTGQWSSSMRSYAIRSGKSARGCGGGPSRNDFACDTQRYGSVLSTAAASHEPAAMLGALTIASAVAATSAGANAARASSATSRRMATTAATATTQYAAKRTRIGSPVYSVALAHANAAAPSGAASAARASAENLGASAAAGPAPPNATIASTAAGSQTIAVVVTGGPGSGSSVPARGASRARAGSRRPTRSRSSTRRRRC